MKSKGKSQKAKGKRAEDDFSIYKIKNKCRPFALFDLPFAF